MKFKQQRERLWDNAKQEAMFKFILNKNENLQSNYILISLGNYNEYTSNMGLWMEVV